MLDRTINLQADSCLQTMLSLSNLDDIKSSCLDIVEGNYESSSVKFTVVLLFIVTFAACGTNMKSFKE